MNICALVPGIVAGTITVMENERREREERRREEERKKKEESR